MFLQNVSRKSANSTGTHHLLSVAQQENILQELKRRNINDKN